MKIINVHLTHYRAVARSENLEGHIVLGGDNVPPLVEIGLTDRPKSGARASPTHTLATGLLWTNLAQSLLLVATSGLLFGLSGSPLEVVKKS